MHSGYGSKLSQEILFDQKRIHGSAEEKNGRKKFFKSTRDNFAPQGNLGMPEVILVAPTGEMRPTDHKKKRQFHDAQDKPRQQ